MKKRRYASVFLICSMDTSSAKTRFPHTSKRYGFSRIRNVFNVGNNRHGEIFDSALDWSETAILFLLWNLASDKVHLAVP